MPAPAPPLRTVRILGTHGVPANYGGFETAAQNVGLFLASRGWRVIMYCQIPGSGPIQFDTWYGLERVRIPIDVTGWRGTSKFDLVSIQHACRYRDICLTFGYNTGVFNILQRLRGIPNIVNMDGIEWSRARWGPIRQAILYVNERISAKVGTHLIADHPEIRKYLLTRAPARKISTITYGADLVDSAPKEPVIKRNLTPGGYMTLICRPIPENSILELVRGFSLEPRGVTLAVLGTYTPETDPYHAAVMQSASDEVLFLGPIYEPQQVDALRYHSIAYLHGHTVGGTNPSLVEAMAAGNPVIAHDNTYNRWVARDAAVYFSTVDDVSQHVSRLISDPDALDRMRLASRERHAEEFTWTHVAGQYEQLLMRFHPVSVGAND